jgi:phage baseplate assembly protein W
MTVTNYQLSLNNAMWVDVNPQYTVNSMPDRIPDGLAIVHGSLFNLFNCVPGERARIFQPEYGSMWRRFIQEPITDVTAAKMQIFMLDAIRKWEPRIALDQKNCRIDADTTLPGFRVRLAFYVAGFSSSQQIQFQVQP